VDDFLGAGSLPDALASQTVAHNVIRAVMGFESLSVKKNVFAQTAEILKILTNCVEGTLRPKDKALDKLYFVLFSIDIEFKILAKFIVFGEFVFPLYPRDAPFRGGNQSYDS